MRNISVAIPKGVLTVVTGVAGSGKSTLINQIFTAQYQQAVVIDQSPIHASKRSNPASYMGIFDTIRQLFARANTVDASLFSFNSEGACPACKGLGVTQTDLAFMDPIVTTCEVCKGRRYRPEVLHYTFRGKAIDEVLGMSITSAYTFFAEPEMSKILQSAEEVGIGYITLGQRLDTLSGGERQRIKLAMELHKTGELYVLDEPTTGLHMADVDGLVRILNRLVDNGSTVIVVEHNIDVIRQADHLIDMGPGAGQQGGRIIFQGTPEEMRQSKVSTTGKYL